MTDSPKRNIEYVIFDMDGLLIDSERIYSRVVDEILAKHGKVITWDMRAGLMGQPIKESSIYLLSCFPDVSIDLDAFLLERRHLQDTLYHTTAPMPGAHRLVHHLKKHNIPIAVATSSSSRNYDLKTAHLQSLFECFESKVVCGDDPKYNMKGKPAPDIFITAAREMLNRDVGYPEVPQTDKHIDQRSKGLVFEDSLQGMQAGKRAGMSVVWVPNPNIRKRASTITDRADQIVDSLEEFIPEQWGLPPYDKPYP